MIHYSFGFFFFKSKSQPEIPSFALCLALNSSLLTIPQELGILQKMDTMDNRLPEQLNLNWRKNLILQKTDTMDNRLPEQLNLNWRKNLK